MHGARLCCAGDPKLFMIPWRWTMTQAHSSCQDWLGSQGAKKICTRSSGFSHIGEMGGRLNTAKGPPPHPRTVSCLKPH